MTDVAASPSPSRQGQAHDDRDRQAIRWNIEPRPSVRCGQGDCSRLPWCTVTLPAFFTELGCRMLYRGIELSVRKNTVRKGWVWSFRPTKHCIVNNRGRPAITKEAAIQSAYHAIDRWFQQNRRAARLLATEAE